MASWLINCTLACTVIPALGIFIVYYDWDFGPGYEHYGYIMQFQFLKLLNLIIDAGWMSLGFAAAAPWFFQMFVLYGCFKSKFYRLSDENRIKFMGLLSKCHQGCLKILLTIIAIFMIMFCIIGSFGNMFDYAADGFFSYSGPSQALHILLYVSFEVQVITGFSLAYNFDAQMQFLEENVQEL